MTRLGKGTQGMDALQGKRQEPAGCAQQQMGHLTAIVHHDLLLRITR